MLSFAKDAQLAGKNVFHIDFQRGQNPSTLEKVWLATSAGLLEYDGYVWRQYGVAQGLPSDFIRCLLVTRQGDLWVGTDRGAGIYDGRTFRTLGSETNLAGISVRRMVEDADGTIWFCSDPWPSSVPSGGLTSWKNGQWQRFTVTDGLPSEYVVNFFRDSSNRQWVVTKEGVARWDGSHWVVSLKPGVGRDSFSSGCFAEIPGRALLFSAGVDVYSLSNTVWALQSTEPKTSYHQHGICTTQDRKILTSLTTSPGRKAIAEWSDAGWTRLSAEFDLLRGYNEDVREAPDGNIWVVGFESVVCWLRHSQWEVFHQLPPPKFVEPSNRIWFGSDSLGILPALAPMRFDRGQWDRLEIAYDDLSVDAVGAVWGWSSNRVTRWAANGTSIFGESDTGLSNIQAGRVGEAGAYWVIGLDRNGKLATARFLEGGWLRFPTPHIEGKFLKSGLAASRDDFWILLRPAVETNAVILQVAAQGTTTIDVPREILSPFHHGLHVSRDRSALWVYGDNGLYRRRSGTQGWEMIAGLPGSTVMSMVEREGEIWVGCNGATGGGVGLSRYREGQWKTFPIRSLMNLSLAADRTLLVGGKGCFTVVDNQRDAVPLEIELPEDIRADGVVKDHAGDYWVGNDATLLRFHPDGIPPETRIGAESTNLLEGARLTINVDAIERFRPLGRRRDHVVAWQMDGEKWSSFQPGLEREFSAHDLGLGRHTISVRARDAGGDIDPTPARLEFTVHPLPWQNRGWFLWSVGSVILLLVTLALIVVRARADLASYARTLEQRVADRTAALEADLVERRRTEAALRESEERWQFALEGSGDGLWDWNILTNQVHFSSRWKSMLGFADHEISDRLEEWENRVHPEDKPRVLTELQTHLDGKVPFYVSEHRLLCKDGTYKWILDRGKVMTRTEDGRPVRVIGTHADIADRKRVEAALMDSEHRLKTTLDSLLEGCQIIGFDLTCLYVNQVAAQQGRRTCEELIGRKLTDIYPEADHHRLYSILRRCLISRVPQRMESVFTYPDGSSATYDLEIRPVADGVFVHSIDVTARRQAELERERLVLLIEHSPDFIATAELTGRLTYLNPAGRRMIGFSETEDIRKLNFADYVPDRWRSWFIETVVPMVRDKGVWEGEMQLFHLQTKKLIDISRSMFLVRNRETGEPIGFATVTRDVTARKAAEKALLQSEERFAKAFRANPAIIAISTFPEGKYVDVNQAFTDLLGFTRAEVLGRTALDLGLWSAPGQRQAIIKALENHELVRGVECQLRAKSGDVLTVLASVEEIELSGQRCLLFINHDITERRLLEAQIRQAQKMEALGTLSGGIAHDFNNILGAIFGNVHLANLDLEPNHPAASSLGEIQKAANRARDLVRQILTFSRQQPKTRQNIPLGPVIQEVAGLLRASLPAGIELQKTLDPKAPNVLADATQIHQIVLNLCTNAWHAIGDGPGRIEIRLQPVRIEKGESVPVPELHPGLYACLSVIDNGHGMDAVTLDRIFEPFFTTKEPGRGTGLGLSVVHGIVQAHDGVIRVSSQRGQGTAFQLYFPAVGAEIEVAAPEARPLRQGSGERILYLDDEKPLVDLAVKMLQRLSYQVDGFTDPSVALKAFSANPSLYQLIISDLHMPGLSGAEFIQAVRKLHPTIPIMLSSGHLTDDVVARVKQLGVARLLHKPNTLVDLSDFLHELLHAKQP